MQTTNNGEHHRREGAPTSLTCGHSESIGEEITPHRRSIGNAKKVTESNGDGSYKKNEDGR
ncbi:MAG: hypothetical protein GY820_39990 [Gammaproteobacteria bacterium]|nr:hypothetical protein [Gammaproteobacteria bacterium]